MVRIQPLILLIALWLMLPACAEDTPVMHDGYYTVEATDFDEEGWKAFITIYVSDNKIVTVECNAKDASGFIKSWDMDYMRKMKSAIGMYPNQYARSYTAALLDKQNPAWVNPMPGAERHHRVFQTLSEAAIAQAKAGNKNVVFIDIPYN